MKFTGYLDQDGKQINIGDICVGKTDYRHPMGQGEGLVEQGMIEDKMTTMYSENGTYLGEIEVPYWNGHMLKNVHKSLVNLGNSLFNLVEVEIINHIHFKK